MKKLINKTIILLLFVALTGCNDWLDVSPKADMKAEDLFGTEAGFRDALVGVYALMCGTNSYGRDLTYGYLDVLAQYYNSPLKTTSSGYEHNFKNAAEYKYTEKTEESRISSIWSNHFSAVANINQAMLFIDENKGVFTSPEVHDVYKGEFLALRAFLHFDILRLFAPSAAMNNNKGLDALAIPYVDVFTNIAQSQLTVKEVLKKILPSMSLSFITTIASYFALFLTSLSLLKQTALFSIFGLTSSFLTVIALYSFIFKNDNSILRDSILNKSKNILKGYINFFNKKYLIFLTIFVILISIISIPKLKVNFSSNQLYNPPNFLINSETEIYKRLGYSISKNIIISRGDTLEDALENEELLENYFTNYMAISKVFYSKNRQKENIKLVENNLMPLLKKQIEDLGFDNETYNNIKSEFENSKNEFLNIEDLIKNMGELKKLILKNNDKYFIISTTEENDKKIIENENIKIFNINSEINEALDKIAKTAIKTALIAYIIIFAFMIILFNKKHAIAIIVIQIISILLNLSVHSIFNLSLNIFSVFALILSIGISIDYCIFFSKSKAKKEVTFLAIFLSMITTALSFGTLSFSGFIPVKSFGLFLFIGILVSFLLSPVLLKINDIID